MTKKFAVKRTKCDDLERKKPSLIIAAVAGLIMAIVCFVLKGDEAKIWKYAIELDIKPGTIRTTLTVVGVIMLLSTVASVIEVIVFSIQKSNYQASYIKVEDTLITGRAYYSSMSQGMMFSVPISEVIHATNNENLKLNLSINTRSGVFNCLQIDKAYEAANLINKLVEESGGASVAYAPARPAYAPAAPAYAPAAPAAEGQDVIMRMGRGTAAPAAAAPAQRFCGGCGAMIPPESSFCTNCGRPAM